MRTDNKDSNKENVSVFLLFFALSGSGLVCSGPLFSLSYTRTHTYVHMCLFSFCLLVRKQERKEEIVEPLHDFEMYIWIFSLSLFLSTVKPCLTFFWRTNRQIEEISFILHNVDTFFINIYTFIIVLRVFNISCRNLYIFWLYLSKLMLLWVIDLLECKHLRMITGY